jgi:4-hydroxy-tetrahydrodipicolinate synthase
VTPFTKDEDIDEEAFRREIRYLVDIGVHGITVSGSTGEGHTLTEAETCLVTRMAVDEVHGKIPVITGIIQDSTRAAIRYGKAVKEEGGAQALQITPVHYTAYPGPEGNIAFFDELGNALQMPLVLYNVVPWNMIEVPTLLTLSRQSWVVAVKQSGGDIHKLADLLAVVRKTNNPLRVLSAVDALMMAAYLMGAHGSVAQILVVLPRLSVALWNACQDGDISRARELHERILPVRRVLEASPRRSRVKAALEIQGRKVGPARRPQLVATAEDLAEIQRVVEESGELSMAPAVAR